MMSFKGQASWTKMMSPGGNLSALACHPTKKVNKAEQLTYLSTKIVFSSKLSELSVLYFKCALFMRRHIFFTAANGTERYENY